MGKELDALIAQVQKNKELEATILVLLQDVIEEENARARMPELTAILDESAQALTAVMAVAEVAIGNRKRAMLPPIVEETLPG